MSIKTKSIAKMEERMAGLEDDPVRHQVLNSAKSFKTSWIDFGQSLYSVWKDKLYKAWGYLTFDAYTAKEIGIRKQTALKLLKSYYFLEKEDPDYLKKDRNEEAPTSTVPTYESVNLLRLASKNKGLDKVDYDSIKKKVLESGREAGEVKKDITQLIKSREELLPEEAWKKRRTAQIRRIISLIKTLRTELKVTKALPAKIAGDIEKLVNALEAEI
ncbi:MAG: hypothetical protein ABH875_01535 [Candidatus Omnitrophota bacterium]